MSDKSLYRKVTEDFPESELIHKKNNKKGIVIAKNKKIGEKAICTILTTSGEKITDLLSEFTKPTDGFPETELLELGFKKNVFKL